MQDVLSIAAKTIFGGVLVLVFSALSETLKPKRFAGILGAAPSVAIAGLAVGAISKGPADQSHAAQTMIAGAVALAVYAAVATVTLRRFGPLKGAAIAGVAWIVVAVGLFPVVS